jgi:hypothetical protein
MRICGILTFCVAVLVSVKTASANVHSGTLCNPVPGDVGSIGYSQFGVHNISTVPRTVFCSAVTDGTVSALSITVYDRDPNVNVDCLVRLMNPDGGVIFSTTLSTSGFSSAPMVLTTATPVVAGVLVLQCSIPANNTTNGASHVTSYTVADSL